MRIRKDEGYLEFDGEELGAASSEKDEDTLRWTEVHIFKTRSGKYVVQKIGRTRVFHLASAGKPCNTYGVPGEYKNVPTYYHGCPICRAEEIDETAIRMEQDRFTVHVSDTAEGLIESTHSQDHDRTAYLTKPAREALTRAAQKDDAIKEAFLVQRID